MRNNGMIIGSEMVSIDQKAALNKFVHRFTKEHVPSWSKKEWKDGKTYPVQFASDREWLENTKFYVTKDGRLDNKHDSCESSATWPDNPELRKIYS